MVLGGPVPADFRGRRAFWKSNLSSILRSPTWQSAPGITNNLPLFRYLVSYRPSSVLTCFINLLNYKNGFICVYLCVSVADISLSALICVYSSLRISAGFADAAVNGLLFRILVSSYSISIRAGFIFFPFFPCLNCFLDLLFESNNTQAEPVY